MSEPKGIYKTQLQGVGISYGSNMPANSIEIDAQIYDQFQKVIDEIRDEVARIKVEYQEAQELIARQAEAIRQRDALYMRYTGYEIDLRTYIAEMQALMSTTSVTGGDER